MMERDGTLDGQVLGRLPGKVRVIAAEVAVRSRLLEDGLSQLHVAQQAAGPEVKVVIDDRHKVLIRLAGAGLGGAVRVDVDGKRVRDTDRVGQLHQNAVAEASVDKGLGHPAGRVRGRSVHLIVGTQEWGETLKCWNKKTRMYLRTMKAKGSERPSLRNTTAVRETCVICRMSTMPSSAVKRSVHVNLCMNSASFIVPI